MSSVVELTLHNGRQVGIPAMSVVLIFNMEKAPDPQAPKAKTLIRYTIDGQSAKHAMVRDSYKHCLSSFPLAIGQQAWAHLTDTKGNDQVIVHKSAAAYEQQEAEDEFVVTFAVPTGPIDLSLRTTIKEVRDMLRPATPVPGAPAEPKAPEAPRAGKAAPAAPRKPRTKPEAKPD
jgi:hypothetical protein